MTMLYKNFIVAKICQDTSRSIECPYGGRITIKSADISRTDRDVCSAGKAWFVWCPSQSVLEQVDGLCKDKTKCQLNYFNNPDISEKNIRLMNDKCQRIDNKVLEVVYECSIGKNLYQNNILYH